jgi:hypothetical protein
MKHTLLGLVLAFTIAPSLASFAAPLQAVVEAEEEVYAFEPANNGAGPMWCHGSTSLGRIGDLVVASGLETLPGVKPLNNCRWVLFARDNNDWKKVAVDPKGRTREPSPLAVFKDGRIFLSVNPTLVADTNAYSGPARPEILQFSAGRVDQPWETILPQWNGSPKFTEHSYRSFAADGASGELILFQNIGYTHAEWAFRDRGGRWSANGKLEWPWGADYEKPQPIRVCYPNVALRNGAVHFCGVSDIVEPKSAWRAYKKELTGREWDYEFRRLFYTWTPDIRSGQFKPWVEIASREETCGWITPGDLWVGPDGRVHILWTERAIDPQLRAKFFLNARQTNSLNYAEVRDGKILARKTLLEAREGGPQLTPASGRFHVTPEGRLFVIYYLSGRDANGRSLSENRLREMREGGEEIRVPLKRPFTEFFTATPRAGSEPSFYIDLMGQQAGLNNRIHYARIRLRNN